MKDINSILVFLDPPKPIPIFNMVDIELYLSRKDAITLLPLDFFNSLLSFCNDWDISLGSWVQVGVWRGGGALFLKALMNHINISFPLYLYDTYGDFPVDKFTHSKDIYFVDYLGLNTKKIPYYKDEVVRLFEDFSFNQNVHFITQDVSNQKDEVIPDEISFLMIDVDFYEPTFDSLNRFYDRVIQGGIIIIDDYYIDILNCKDAVDDFFKLKGINLFDISRQFSSYSILIIKP